MMGSEVFKKLNSTNPKSVTLFPDGSVELITGKDLLGREKKINVSFDSKLKFWKMVK